MEGCCGGMWVRLREYKIGDKTQVSCIYHVNVHDEYFAVCFLQAFCSSIREPVEVYTSWYMKCYQKDMFCREHIFLD